MSRKRIGQPRSITLTSEQQAFIEQVMKSHEITFCQAVRNIVRDAMKRFIPENTTYSNDLQSSAKVSTKITR